jgi:hypothetical protein
MPALRRRARRADVDDASDGSAGIDGESLVVAGSGGRDAGKSRHIGFARTQRVLRRQRLERKDCEGDERRAGDDRSHRW